MNVYHLRHLCCVVLKMLRRCYNISVILRLRLQISDTKMARPGFEPRTLSQDLNDIITTVPLHLESCPRYTYRPAAEPQTHESFFINISYFYVFPRIAMLPDILHQSSMLHRIGSFYTERRTVLGPF